MFLKATKKGFMYSVNNIEESTNILYKYLNEDDKKINLEQALNFSKKYFGGEDNFGNIDEKVLFKFFEWLHLNKIEKVNFDVQDFYERFDY